jgi:FG-GAP-like repeat/ASPIC and UnbV
VTTSRHAHAALWRPSTTMVLVCLSWACDTVAPQDVPDGTLAMVERLAPLSLETDPERNRFANEAIVQALLQAPRPTRADNRLLFDRQVAEQLLYAGRHREAIERFTVLLEELVDFQSTAPPSQRAPESFRIGVEDLLAVSYLRLAERRGCLTEGQATDCAIPAPENPWRTTAEIQSAIEIYLRTLEESPNALGPRWMLNLAHMMIGGFPEQVPDRWRIDPSVFDPEADLGRFNNIAGPLQVDVLGNVGGAIMDDLNGDGFLDIMASSWGPADTLRLFLNDGTGGFEDRSAESGLIGLYGGGNLYQADYDNDGDLDVFVPRGGWLVDGQPNSLLRNRGDGTFQDVTSGAGLLDSIWHPTQTATWADFNGDGWLDLFVGNESFRGEVHPAQLFLNRRDGTFTEVGEQAGVALVGIIKGVAAADIDNDGDVDLYATRLGEPNVLMRNTGNTRGVPRFSDVTAVAGVAEPIDAFPAWFWDFDNDGWEDLFVAGYRTNYGDALAEYLRLPHDSELARLYRNRGDGTFDEVSVEVGLDKILFGMGSNFGDLDNDGWLDAYIGTGDAFFQALLPNRMFRNDGGHRFQEVTTTGFGLIQKGHGVAFGDLDHDGDQDFYVTMGGAYAGDVARNVLYLNPGHGNRWITLILEGTRSNRSAIGARVRVTVPTDDGPRTLHRTVGSGGSFGASTLRVEVGLGQTSGPAAVEIDWPSGEHTRLHDLEIDRGYRVVEGRATEKRGEAEVVALRPIDFNSGIRGNPGGT